MKVDQATVDAVNAWQTARVVPYQDMKDGRLVALDLDADDVQSLLAALAKCEPVRGLVDAATEAQGELEALGCACQPQADGETDLGPCAMCLLGPALAPFTEGGE